jgi:hypothetical protein
MGYSKKQSKRKTTSKVLREPISFAQSFSVLKKQPVLVFVINSDFAKVHVLILSLPIPITSVLSLLSPGPRSKHGLLPQRLPSPSVRLVHSSSISGYLKVSSITKMLMKSRSLRIVLTSIPTRSYAHSSNNISNQYVPTST